MSGFHWEETIHVDARNWYVVVSNLFFILPAVVAWNRNELIRFAGFLLVCGVSSLYHFCFDTHVCDPELVYRQLDHVASVWMATTIVLLFSTYPRGVEYMLEMVLLAVAAAMVFFVVDVRDDENSTIFEIAYPASVAVLLVPPSWAWKGYPVFQEGRAFIGLAMLLVSLLLFYLNIFQDERLSHGTWHVLAALGTTLLIQAMRDVRLHHMQQYRMVTH